MSDSDLAVRAARAEMERDAALERVDQLSRSLQAFVSRDKDGMLDTLRILGMPARDLADIYKVVDEWHKEGGRPALIEEIRERWRLKARVAELEALYHATTGATKAGQ